MGDWLDLPKKRDRIKELEYFLQQPDAWDNSDEAQSVLKEHGVLLEMVNSYENLEERFSKMESKDEVDEKEIGQIDKELSKLENNKLFNGKYDMNNAVLIVRSGAGGDDAADWTKMLYDMYKKYAERSGWSVKIIDVSGDYGENSSGEHPIKNITFEIDGPFAYGHLKYESGVHRLIRISPFSSKGLRHTSFALVEVLPKLKERQLDIKDSDLKVDFFRSSGPGGQNVNKVETAVRITHVPTGIVVSSQVGRSQAQNREHAMNILEAKLISEMKDKQVEQLDNLKTNSNPEWGSQIRTYTLNPYQLVKDHRTDYETTQVKDVIENGELDNFIEAELVHFNKEDE